MFRKYAVKVYTLEYLNRYFHYDNVKYFYQNAGGKSRLWSNWAGKVIEITKYGEQEELEIPNWAVELHVNSDEYPEYFI